MPVLNAHQPLLLALGTLVTNLWQVYCSTAETSNFELKNAKKQGAKLC